MPPAKRPENCCCSAGSGGGRQRGSARSTRISEPGAVFGELSCLLQQPHSADVRALERSEFTVADAATLLAGDSTATLYVAAKLAGRLDAANGALLELKRQLETGAPRAAVAQAVDKVAGHLGNADATAAGTTAASLASPGPVEATARTSGGVSDAPPPKPASRSGAFVVPDAATIQKSLATLPVSTYEPGETVLAAGETSGKLLLLRKGLVEVVKAGTQIARISEPGAVFGELAFLSDRPHSSDVRALERSEFIVADAADAAGKRFDRRALRRGHHRGPA